MTSEPSGGGGGGGGRDRREPRDQRGRLLVPEQDRRRDPRDDPAILDLSSVREQDGDHPEGWTDPATLSAGFGGGGGSSGAAPGGGDWTELVAPDLAPDPMREAWRDSGRWPTPRRGRTDSERYDSVLRGDEDE